MRRKHCHVCNGRGIRLDKDLMKISCPKCKGTGEPQPIKRKRVNTTKKYSYSKSNGIELLKYLKEE